MPAESSEKMISPAVADPPDVKPPPPSVAGNTVDQKRLKLCRQRLFGVQSDLKSEMQNGDPSLNAQAFPSSICTLTFPFYFFKDLVQTKQSPSPVNVMLSCKQTRTILPRTYRCSQAQPLRRLWMGRFREIVGLPTDMVL